MPNERKEDALPRAVVAMLGTGKKGCRRCNGDGVVVVPCLTGAAYRPCDCARPQRTKKRVTWKAFAA